MEGEKICRRIVENTTLLEITDEKETFDGGNRLTTDVQQQQHCVINSNVERSRYEFLYLERQNVKCTEQLTAVRPEQRENWKTQ